MSTLNCGWLPSFALHHISGPSLNLRDSKYLLSSFSHCLLNGILILAVWRWDCKAVLIFWRLLGELAQHQTIRRLSCAPHKQLDLAVVVLVGHSAGSKYHL
jgi:hypothetical protein